MESALRPREIQTRIRAGESVEDVARAAGVPVERVEPYAAPVLAEREHIAGLAQRGSARRRGENSGHRELRHAVAERLGPRGIDPESVRWDSFRMDDGRWSVSAGYSSGDASREAVFHFDPRGRFSVAGNDEARWVLGEQSPLHGPQPGRQPGVRRPVGSEDPDSEPTLDLHDELALVRAVQGTGPGTAPDQDADQDSGQETGQATGDRGPDDRDVLVTEQVVVEAVVVTGPVGTDDPDADPEQPVDELDEASELDLLYDMLGGAGYTEDSGRVYPGLSEAPGDTGPSPKAGWEPGVVINYPIEPEPEPSDGSDEHVVDDVTGAGLDPRKVRTVTEPTMVDSDPVESHPSDDTSQEEEIDFDEGSGVSEAPEPEPVPELLPAPGSTTDNDASVEDAVPETDEAPATIPPELQEPSAPPSDEPSDALVEAADAPEAPEAPEDVTPAAAPAKPARKRKRAEVPSWDEIMFGGPKRN